MLNRNFWISWVWANACAELLGLGATFLLGYGIYQWLGEPQSTLGVVAFVLLMTTTGVVEGSVVGYFQFRVLRIRFQAIRFKDWWLATLIGALAAWFLGSLPSSFMGDPSTSAAVEPPLAFVLLLACGMGLVLGVILALPQWRVLDRYVEGSWRWLPANGLAWCAGMPLIFAGIDIAQRMKSTPSVLIIMAVTLAFAGAVVGAIHGAFLLRFRPRLQAPM